MTSLEMTGKSIIEAVELGAKELGVGLSDIEYEVIDEPSKGFLGFGARPAKVVVRLAGSAAEEDLKVKQEKKNEQPKAAKKSEPKKAEVKKAEPKKQPKSEVKAEPKKEESVNVAPVVEETKEAAIDEDAQNAQSERMNLTQEDKDKIVGTARNFLTEVFEAMNMQVNLDIKFEDNKQIIVEMTGSDMGIIIGKRGQTLDSLQYLTNLVVNKGEYPYMNVTLDTEGYRVRRKETLEHLAFNLAKKAKHIRKNVILEPMNPYERRIIHSTLQNDRYVTTYSEGTEPYRYVVISPKPGYRGGYRKSNYNRTDKGFKSELSETTEN